MKNKYKINTFILAMLTIWSASTRSDPLFPSELVDFSPYKNNPVMLPGSPGSWDENIRERGWIIKDGDQYRQWYTGHMNEGVMRLGYATSDDGFHWKRDKGNPLYSAHWIEDINIVKKNNLYYMFAEGLYDRAHLLTSADGRNWTRKWQLKIHQTDGTPIKQGPYGTPVGWYENDTWYLLYERNDLGFWLAKSNNLITWTNVQDTPVMQPGPDTYDNSLIAPNQIIKYKNRYYLYYHSRDKTDKNWSINIATSTDLRHWIKYGANPLLPAKWNKASGIVVQDGNCFRLYTTHQQVEAYLSKSNCSGINN